MSETGREYGTRLFSTQWYPAHMVGLPSRLGGSGSTAGFMSEGPEDSDSTGTSDTHRSGRERTGRIEAAPRTVLGYPSMPAHGDTPCNGENVSEAQPLEQRLLTHLLRRSTEGLHGALRQAISDAERGELTRDQYGELIALYHDLGETLEFVDEYTYEQQREGGD